MTETEIEVLIVGSGPTGLVLALHLKQLGVRVRIIDLTDGPGTTSRATVLHARNLEFYRQFGIADAVIDGGLKFAAANMWVRGSRAARIQFTDFGPGISRYPFALIYPQDQHEKLLVEQLGRLGVRVERQTELVSFELLDRGVRARLKTADGAVHACEARYLAGCDGARSKVRENLRIGFPGGTYADVFYVADIVGSGPPVNRELNLALDDADFLAIFPMKDAGNVRLVGSVKPQSGTIDDLRWKDVSQRVIDHLKLKVDTVRWFSTYQVHHRVAAKFRRGPAFLLGDAAHIHSPVGGQGMNTGIGDAVNLAWKLASVLQGRIDPSVLDTYEPERMAFARKLVATTDRAFELVTARGPIATRVRLTLAPFLLSKIFKFRLARRFLFRTLSQIAIQYRQSPLSAGAAGSVRGGDRLPWVELDECDCEGHDNYASLGARDWQVHCYGEVTPAAGSACDRRGLELRTFSWQSSMRQSGLKRNALYLIRPDGHVGLAEPTGDAPALERYLDEHKIRSVDARS